jgi:uncharacterized protein (UPF0264 family)
MTRMLASVNNLDEARLVLNAGVDIIDMKEPADGALGAVQLQTVKQIVGFVNGRCQTSATVGDLPMEPQIISRAVTEMASTHVDFIKIGFFSDKAVEDVIAKLERIKDHVSLIAVLFADIDFDLTLIEKLKKNGFTGVMMDTVNKSKQSLIKFKSQSELAEFIVAVKKQNMLCGLAGSLHTQDVPSLLDLQPDYLGFRGALCKQGQRTSAICREAVNEVRKSIPLT